MKHEMAWVEEQARAARWKAKRAELAREANSGFHPSEVGRIERMRARRDARIGKMLKPKKVPDPPVPFPASQFDRKRKGKGLQIMEEAYSGACGHGPVESKRRTKGKWVRRMKEMEAEIDKQVQRGPSDGQKADLAKAEYSWEKFKRRLARSRKCRWVGGERRDHICRSTRAPRHVDRSMRTAMRKQEEAFEKERTDNLQLRAKMTREAMKDLGLKLSKRGEWVEVGIKDDGDDSEDDDAYSGSDSSSDSSSDSDTASDSDSDNDSDTSSDSSDSGDSNPWKKTDCIRCTKGLDCHSYRRSGSCVHCKEKLCDAFTSRCVNPSAPVCSGCQCLTKLTLRLMEVEDWLKFFKEAIPKRDYAGMPCRKWARRECPELFKKADAAAAAAASAATAAVPHGGDDAVPDGGDDAESDGGDKAENLAEASPESAEPDKEDEEKPSTAPEVKEKRSSSSSSDDDEQLVGSRPKAAGGEGSRH